MKLTRFIIRARDYRKSFEFYKNVLGLRLASSWQRKDSWGAIFPAGNSDIEITWFPSGEGLEACNYIPPINKTEVMLEVHDIDIVYGRLRAAGAEIIDQPHDTSWGFRVFSLKDPDNIKITISQQKSKDG
jgi:catechol 2,3-dioxygenase-like lactoylglutathione lyase family enzyme